MDEEVEAATAESDEKRVANERAIVNVEYEVTDIQGPLVTLDPHDEVFGPITLNRSTVLKVHQDGTRNFALPHVVTCHSLQGTSQEGIVIYEMDHPRAKKEWILAAVTRSRSLDRILVYTGYLPRKLSAINEVVCTRDESDVDLDVVRGFLKDVYGKSAEPHPDPARTVWDPFKKIWLKDN